MRLSERFAHLTAHVHHPAGRKRLPLLAHETLEVELGRRRGAAVVEGKENGVTGRETAGAA